MKNEAMSLRLVESLFHLVLRSLSFSLERVSIPVNLSSAPLLDLLAIPDRVKPSGERGGCHGGNLTQSAVNWMSKEENTYYCHDDEHGKGSTGENAGLKTNVLELLAPCVAPATSNLPAR